MAKKIGNIIASWAFLVGVLLAIIAGILSAFNIATLNDSTLMLTLVIIGLIVGLFNVTNKETTPFLISGTCLVIISFFGLNLIAISLLSAILFALLGIFIPATIIVAIKNVFSIAKN